MNAPQYPCLLLAAALLLGSILPATAADQTATWNSTTGNWSDPTKWNTNPLFPNNGNGGFTFDAIQNGGTLTVNQAITIEKYNLTGGTNTGTGLTLTLNDLLTWTGGTLDGSGLISADGGANLSGASTKFLNGTRQLNLSGTSTWSGGNITQQSSSTLRNLAGGVFTTSHDGNLAGGFMNNLGTFTKSAGGGTTTVSSHFYNSGGMVNANSGILNFTNGGEHTGTFSAGTGATLQFGGGTHNLNAGASLTGAGTISVTGGTVSANAAVSSGASTTFSLAGGTFSGTGTLTVNGPMTWSGGTLLGTSTLNSTANTTWSAGQINAGAGAVFNNSGSFTTTFDGTFNPIGGTAPNFNNSGTFIKSGGAGTTTFGNGGYGPANFNNTGTVQVNSGTLALNGNGTHTNSLFSIATGSTLSLGGTHTFSSASTSTIDGAGLALVAGTMSVNGGGTVNVSAPLRLAGTLNGTGTVHSTTSTNWTTGTLTGAGTLNVSGVMTINGGPRELSGGWVINSTADTTWSAGQINASGGAVFNNNGTFTTTFDGTYHPIGGPSSQFNNAGTFIKSGGTGTTTFNATGHGPTIFNNTGTVQVNSGTLALSGGGSSTGTFQVSSGTVLNFSGGTHTVSGASASIEAVDTGIVRFGGGTTNINGGSYTVAGTTQISGGAANFNIAASTAALTVSSGELGGTGVVTTPTVIWSGGTLRGAGTLNVSGVMTLNGGDRVLSEGRVINSTASTTWSAGQINASGGAVFNNYGTFTTNFDGTVSPSGGDVRFNNIGTFIKSGGVGATTFGSGGYGPTVFNNTGTVNVNSGTLALNGNGTHTNSLFSIASGSTLSLSGTQTFSSASTSTIDGAGLALVAGTMSVNGGGTVNVSAPLRLAGTLNGTGTVHSTTSTNWTTGTLTGAGTLNVSGVMTINGGPRELSGGWVINSTADTTWSAGQINASGGAVFNNNGTFTTTFDGTISPSGGDVRFNNIGTFIKSGGVGATTFGSGGYGPTVFNNTGTVNVNSGTLALNGTVTQHSGTTLTAGTWNVTNGAAISIATGSNITTNGAASTVILDGAGSSFNRLTTALNNNQGSFTLKNNRDLTTAGAYTNSGTTRVEDSTTVMTIGSGGSAAYTQTIGETVLVGGAIIDASVFNLNGGELKGNGTIASSVVTGGTNTIAPGLSPGSLTIEGNLTLSAGSTLDMEIGGLTQGTLYDYLDVNGTLTLAGLLNLSFLNDFQNSLGMGSLFTLATSDAAVLGSFSNVANGGFLTDMASLHTFSVHYGAGSLYNPNNVVLYAVTPEPGRALLLMLGLLGLTLRRKRHACAVDSASV